jgi:hypothetical protein
MPTGTRRRLAFIALVLALVVLVRVLTDGPQDEERSPAPATSTAEPVRIEAPSPVDASAPAASARVSTPREAGPGAPVASRDLVAMQARVQVHAPANVRVGEVFDVHVRVEAQSGVRELLFAIRYDKTRLALAGVTEGDFAPRSGLRADFAADEPSDGNVQLSLSVRDGLWIAGAGSIAILRFEATGAGTLAITAQDLAAVESTGARYAVAQLHEAAITIR